MNTPNDRILFKINSPNRDDPFWGEKLRTNSNFKNKVKLAFQGAQKSFE